MQFLIADRTPFSNYEPGPVVDVILGEQGMMKESRFEAYRAAYNKEQCSEM